MEEKEYLMNSKIIISGYDKLLRLARSILRETDIPSGVNVELIPTHIFMPSDAPPKLKPSDVLVCGHQTSLFLQNHYAVKSIPVKITGFELLRSISEAITYSREITIINFLEDIPDIEKYASLLNIKLRQITFRRPEELTDILMKLKAQGAKAVIGSSLICDQAEK